MPNDIGTVEGPSTKTKKEKKLKKKKMVEGQFNFDGRSSGYNRYSNYYDFNNEMMNLNYPGYNRPIYYSRDMANSYYFKKGYTERDHINNVNYKRGNYKNKDNMHSFNFNRDNYMGRGFGRVSSKFRNKKFSKGKDKGSLMNPDIFAGHENNSYESILKSSKSVDINMSVRYPEYFGDLYNKISFYLKKNRKYLQRIVKKNYTIRIYLVRHFEAVHNRKVLENPNKPRDMFYKMIEMKDCPASQEGISNIQSLRDASEYFKEITDLYNASMRETVHVVRSVTKYNRGGEIGGGKTFLEDSASNMGAFERNKNFITICSPLRRCLETLNLFLNIKENIIIHEAVRETSGNYYCDSRSKTSEIRKYCNEHFKSYDLLCYGEKDIMDVDKARESRAQIECRCLQFLKLIHSLAINYFASVEKELEENMLKKNKQVAIKEEKSKGSKENTKEEKKNLKNEEKEVLENEIEKEMDKKNKEIVGNEDAEDSKKKKEKKELEKDGDANVYTVLLVSHSSFINHLLALLDYFEINERFLKNCEIKKISIPLTNAFLFYNNVSNLQSARPTLLSTIPLSFKNKIKILKKTSKDKYIYTLKHNSDFEHLICTQPCTVVIYRYDLVSKDVRNQQILERIKKFIEENNKIIAKSGDNASNEEKEKEKEKEKTYVVYSNGMYKKYVSKNKHLGRTSLVTDGTNYLKYLEDTGTWEIKNRGLFLRQNVVLIVLPNIDILTNKRNTEGEEKKEAEKKEKEKNEEQNEEKDKEKGNEVDTEIEKSGEKLKEEATIEDEKSKWKKKNKKEDMSIYFENIKTVINDYDNLEDLMRSINFWKVLKYNIKNLEIYSFQEYLLEKFHKIIKNETDVCYLDLVECIENKSFIQLHQNKCNGYFKTLKEKLDRNIFIDFEQECKYINENLLQFIFPEHKKNDEKGTFDHVQSNVHVKKEEEGIQMNETEKGKEKGIESEKGIGNYVKRKFIYIPKKSHAKYEKQQLEKQEKQFFASCIKLLKWTPAFIQNLDVEVFYQDTFFYIHCLHQFIKSKSKTEGLVIVKLLCFLDLLKSCDISASNNMFQNLMKVYEHVAKNGELKDKIKLEKVDKLSKGDKRNTFICEDKVKAGYSTFYCSEGIHKYKTIQSLSGKKKSVVEDLNCLRFNILTACGGAENVFILNIVN